VTPFKLPDRYERTDEYYSGGQGYVWIYKDAHLNRKVAVKFLKPTHNQQVLLKEMASIRSIRSKHVAQIYDLQFHKNTNRPALIQEYVGGPDVLDIARQHLTLDQTLSILYQIAAGIADVHACSKIHRDIKPTNIKRDDEGVFKLLDFGLSCDASSEAITHAARGTLAFLPPEMYGTPPVKVTSAVDAYAFGVTAWMLLSRGEIPLPLQQIPPDPVQASFAEIEPNLPHAVIQVFDRTLSPIPSRRPEMRVVRDALKSSLTYGKHRAVICATNGSEPTVLSGVGYGVRLKAGESFVQIVYDGLHFRIQQMSPDVLINNTKLLINSVLPDSCVIAIKNGPATYYVFDVSHPEVVL
jgi:serine/threonine-protein kinase